MLDRVVEGMVAEITESRDLTDIGLSMVEAVPTTLEEMMEEIIGEEPEDFDEEYDEKVYQFNDTLWVALARTNSYAAEREHRLLRMLMDHTIRNAREIAHQIWKDGDEDGIYDELVEAIERCEAGNGTDRDWDLLAEQTEM